MDWKKQSDEYLVSRVENQVNWYNDKSGFNKRWYYRCRVLVIGSGALIPLLVGYADGDWDFLKYVAGFLGVVVSISEGVLSLKKYQENWSIYRMTAEQLHRERLLFENNVGEDYSSGDEAAFKRFVIKAEQIMAAENDQWNALLKETTEGDQGEGQG
ncbi:MAG: DUF4231 domain-containing protein [Bacteroidetes bacterium]|nr:MAG: DUF4231 domain-containing protein [Bacteroidota bacterium]